MSAVQTVSRVVELTHNTKWWHASTRPDGLEVRYGPHNAAGQKKFKPSAQCAKGSAHQELTRLVESKIRKGYRIVRDERLVQPSAPAADADPDAPATDDRPLATAELQAPAKDVLATALGLAQELGLSIEPRVDEIGGGFHFRDGVCEFGIVPSQPLYISFEPDGLLGAFGLAIVAAHNGRLCIENVFADPLDELERKVADKAQQIPLPALVALRRRGLIEDPAALPVLPQASHGLALV